MNAFTKPMLLAGIALLATSTTANAQADHRDVVRDMHGKIVRNTFDNCVRTMWMTDGDACGTPEPRRYAQPAPAPAPRATIAKAERTVYFGFNQATLNQEARERLDSLATRLRSDRDVRQARIVGYADRIGSTSYNEKLSQRRAQAVQSHLVSRGIVTAPATETRWLGESAPATQCPNSLSRPKLIECLRNDRRVEVEIDYISDRPARSGY